MKDVKVKVIGDIAEMRKKKKKNSNDVTDLFGNAVDCHPSEG